MSHRVYGIAALSVASLASLVWSRAKQDKKQAEEKATTWSQHGKNLNSAFQRMAALFLDDIKSKFNFPDDANARLERLLTYTCLGGKCNRGALVLSSVEHLTRSRGLVLTDELRDQALAAGWAIEALQAMFLVADDIMDQSKTRRGQPCWYLLPGIGYDAVNDSLILESFVFFLLKHFFGNDLTKFSALNELYREVNLQTQLGQMLDLVSNPQGRERPPGLLAGFTLENLTRIHTYKTAFYSFYLPIAAGFIICGEGTSDQFAVIRELSIEIGCKFQIQDDYLVSQQSSYIIYIYVYVY